MFFLDGYSLHSYGRMVNERARTHAFAEALRRAIQPGSVVLDIGTGAGIFAFLACKYGAAKVYAVEPDTAIEVAKRCAAQVTGSERIHWIQGLSTEIDLPEKVDIVIGDLHGMLPFYNGNIESLVDARHRHLKPGGQMIPARDVMRLVPAHAPEEYESVTTPWCSNEYGIPLEAGLPFVTNHLWRAKSAPALAENLLAEPQTWGVIDYQTVESASVDGRAQATITRSGVLHGFYVWFDGETADGLGFSNAPNLDEIVYGRAFFPLERPVDVSVGDLIDVRMSAILVGPDFVFRWNTRIESSAGHSLAKFRQSSFNAKPVRPTDLAKSSAGFMPQLGRQGELDRAILEAMSGTRSLSAIAADIHGQFPAQFRNYQAAYDRVARLSVRYAEGVDGA